MRHPSRALVVLALALGSLLGPAASAAIPVKRLAAGLSSPLFVAAPAGDDRLFIVERAGRIRILAGGAVLPTPFLDIAARVNQGGEGGLLGLAFAPDYAQTRAFYVYYTADGEGGSALTSRVSRFRANASNPDVADDDPQQEKILLSVAQPYANHNGGTIAFGADGMLYFGLGDGGDGGDPLEAAQDPERLLGKMLRLDVDFGSFDDDYAIPDGNPFDGPDGVRDEIWAFGLRNPYRFSFDRETGDLYLGDVGQGAREEVDVEPAGSPGGRNYGWDVMEGTICYTEPPDPGEPACDDPSLTLPVHDYGHGVGCSITGGYVYRGPVADLRGHYFFADYCADRVWTLRWDGGDGILGSVVDRTSELAPDQGSIGSIVGFGEDGAGNLHIVDSGGEVFLVPEPAGLLLAASGAAALGLAGRRRRP